MYIFIYGGLHLSAGNTWQYLEGESLGGAPLLPATIFNNRALNPFSKCPQYIHTFCRLQVKPRLESIYEIYTKYIQNIYNIYKIYTIYTIYSEGGGWNLYTKYIQNIYNIYKMAA